MASKGRLNPFQFLWNRWKALHLPWRTHFLVGRDLQGNTFWEFRDARGNTTKRWRRIVKYPRTAHYSDVNVSPLWHQWLRHTRELPPSLNEQRQDLVRQDRIKVLAAQADARWDAKPRAMDAPAGEAEAPGLPAVNTGAGAATATGSVDAEVVAATRKTQRTETDAPSSGKEATAGPSTPSPGRKPPDDPWERAKGPSENWQPEAWSPAPGGKASRK